MITEIINDPDVVSDTNGEWFEIYNPGSSPVDLRGMRVHDERTDTFTVTGSEPVIALPRAYSVLAISSNSSINGGLSNVTYVYGTSFTLGNSNTDAVILELGPTGSPTVIDTVVYAATGTSWPSTMGYSKQLRPPLHDATANDMGMNWCPPIATTRYGTGGTGDRGTPGALNNCM